MNRWGHRLRPPAAASISCRCIPPLHPRHSFLGTSHALAPQHGRRLVPLRRTVAVRIAQQITIHHRHTSQQARAVQSPPAPSETSEPSSDALTDLARLNLRRAAVACRRYGWFGFWSQLILSVVSTVILMFSAAFTQQVSHLYLLPTSTLQRAACVEGQSTYPFAHLLRHLLRHAPAQNAPAVSVYLTFFGVVLGFLSTFWSWSYTRLSRRLFFYVSSPALDGTKQVCLCGCGWLGDLAWDVLMCHIAPHHSIIAPSTDTHLCINLTHTGHPQQQLCYHLFINLLESYFLFYCRVLKLSTLSTS